MLWRLQLSVEPTLLRRAKARAKSLGVPLAEHVRRLLTRDLDLADRGVGPSAVFNLGSSGGSDISRERDSMLAAAIATDLGLDPRPPKRPAERDHRS